MHEEKKKKKNSLNKRHLIYIGIIKVLIIAFILAGFYYMDQPKTNSMSLLSVKQSSTGKILSGSTINLSLKVTRGTGETYVNLNTLEETDTQVSIVNSKNIACDLFQLDCEKYDFHYEFKGPAVLLKGPSASSAIAILTAKTLRGEDISSAKTTITGTLNAGGVIGNVGGVDKKVKAAKQAGYEKVIIPEFSKQNPQNYSDVEVVKALDIIEAYNHFGYDNYHLKDTSLNKSSYTTPMKNLANKLCQRNEVLKESINTENISENSTLSNILKNARKSYNSSIQAKEKSNFYSQGSFCYNSNINYRLIQVKQNNITKEELNSTAEKFKEEVDKKFIEIDSKEYKNKIKTLNDFYVYLILQDRIKQAKQYMEKIFEDYSPSMQVKFPQNNSSANSSNHTNNSISSPSMETMENNYAYAKERFYTVKLWEELINHEGEKVDFDTSTIKRGCKEINTKITMKSQILKTHGVDFLTEEINKQRKYSQPGANKYLCLYRGLERLGKINTILNSVGISAHPQEKEFYAQKMLNFTETRLALNNKGSFPLIPYIYYEYSGDLLSEGNTDSSMLYSNYALAYADLNHLITRDKISLTMFEIALNKLFENYVFIGALLILVAFLS